MAQLQPELALVSAAQAGDKRAFGQLIEYYEPMARKVALRMVTNPEIARELTQEAMLQAYLSLARLQDARYFAGWLYGIVLNVCRSYRRADKIPTFSLEAMMGGIHFDLLPFSSAEPGPHEVAEMRELHTQVLAAINALAPKNREVTLLFYYEQLSLQEIAALLSVSVSAVKVRLHRSRTQLRDLLAPLYREIDSPEIHANRRVTMSKVTIADVICEEETKNRVIVLMDEAGQRLLPIWIGPFEADAIAIQLLNQPVPRPLTFDFTARLLEAAGATIEDVRIEALKGNTYYAVVKLRSGDRVHEVDARPSDAIALAVRTNSPIYVAEAVMEHAGEVIPEGLRKAPLRKGLDTLAQQLAEKRREIEQKLQEHREEEAAKTQAERTEARQKLLTYLFGSEA